MSRSSCEHLDAVVPAPPTSTVCDQCVAMGDRWVHLRACLVCGQVGCCDSSKNKHATRHFHDTGHPTVRSMEPGERWAYCYVDDVMVRL